MSSDARWLVGWQGRNQEKKDEPEVVTVWETANGKSHLSLELPKFMSDIAISSENHRLAAFADTIFSFFGTWQQAKKLTSFDLGKSASPLVAFPDARITFTGWSFHRAATGWPVKPACRRRENSIVVWNTSTGKREFEFDPPRASRATPASFFSHGPIPGLRDQRFWTSCGRPQKQVLGRYLGAILRKVAMALRRATR